MRTWIWLVATIAVVLGALGWCVQAVAEGGPAMLEPPPEVAALDGTIFFLAALFLVLWISTIFALSMLEPTITHENRGGRS